MREEHQHDQRNCGKIFPGELCRSGMCNPTRVDISTTRHLGYGGAFAGAEKMIWETFLPCLFFGDKKPLTHLRSYKYNIGQEIRTGNPESSDVITVEMPKLPEGERGTDSGHDRGRDILQCQPPTNARVRNT